MCLGVPGQVIEVHDAATHTAAVMVSGVRRTVDISLIDDEAIAPGDWIMVHAGFALDKLDEREARETLAVLQELSDAFMGVAAPTPTTDLQSA